MKELKDRKLKPKAEDRISFIQEIVEFYQIQPGISVSHLEKVEEYLLLMNSLWNEANEDLVSIGYGQVNQEDMIDVLNSYINSVMEESYKIFPDQNLEIIPLHQPGNVSINEIQILEYLRNLNQGEINRFRIEELLEELDEHLYQDDFLNRLLQVVENLIEAINSEMIVKVEELI